MTLTVIAGGRHAGRTINARLRRENRELNRHNEQLVAGLEQREDEVHTALLRGCQDAIRIAQLERGLDEAVSGIRKTQGDLVRAKAEQERLRRAVINACPKITVAYMQPDRPYVSHVVLPYPVPVGRCTANDETQQLPVIELPQRTP